MMPIILASAFIATVTAYLVSFIISDFGPLLIVWIFAFSIGLAVVSSWANTGNPEEGQTEQTKNGTFAKGDPRIKQAHDEYARQQAQAEYNYSNNSYQQEEQHLYTDRRGNKFWVSHDEWQRRRDKDQAWFRKNLQKAMKGERTDPDWHSEWYTNYMEWIMGDFGAYKNNWHANNSNGSEAAAQYGRQHENDKQFNWAEYYRIMDEDIARKKQQRSSSSSNYSSKLFDEYEQFKKASSNKSARDFYHEGARKFHPDVNKTPGADAIFRKLSEDYKAKQKKEKENRK